jgi:hypothetical protein
MLLIPAPQLLDAGAQFALLRQQRLGVYRSIDAYRNALGKSGDILVLDPSSDFFRYLNNADGTP